jgi:hypothetical protein
MAKRIRVVASATLVGLAVASTFAACSIGITGLKEPMQELTKATDAIDPVGVKEVFRKLDAALEENRSLRDAIALATDAANAMAKSDRSIYQVRLERTWNEIRDLGATATIYVRVTHRDTGRSEVLLPDTDLNLNVPPKAVLNITPMLLSKLARSPASAGEFEIDMQAAAGTSWVVYEVDENGQPLEQFILLSHSQSPAPEFQKRGQFTINPALTK